MFKGYRCELGIPRNWLSTEIEIISTVSLNIEKIKKEIGSKPGDDCLPWTDSQQQNYSFGI